VAHRRQELALGRARGLGLLAGLAELLGAVHVVGDVGDRRDRALIGGPALGDPDRAARAGAELERAGRLAVVRQAPRVQRVG
jgi:hypothetical protein